MLGWSDGKNIKTTHSLEYFIVHDSIVSNKHRSTLPANPTPHPIKKLCLLQTINMEYEEEFKRK